MTTSITHATDWPLPALRADIEIVPGPSTRNGAPTWTVVDPVRNRFFQIGWHAFQFLSRWTGITAQQLMAKVRAETVLQPELRDVEQLTTFLRSHNLTQDVTGGLTQRLLAQAETNRPHWLTWLLHHYLFFRIPLFHPHRRLQATMPWVRPFYSRTAGWLFLLVGLTGLFRVGRSWDEFTNTFLYFFSLKGVVTSGLVLAATKVFHELGHAYTATRFGCRVSSMGVACLVMIPVLYTDTTGAWRLTDRRQRLAITAAGPITELALAGIALLVWSLAEEGLLRSAAFLMATSSIGMSLLINLNPLMKFDGYYLLSDWLGVPNLQERAFALGRWKLRGLLFGIAASPPEPLARPLRTQLILYAWAVWLYRLVVFTGIALLVYHFFFKVLGIGLFAVEIAWFILLPIAREARAWWRMKQAIGQSIRPWLLLAGLATLVLAAALPLPTRVSLPAVLEADPHVVIYAPIPARVRAVTVMPGEFVKQGQTLALFEAPALDHDIAVTRKRIELLRLKSNQAVASPEDLAKNDVVLESLRSRLTELEGLFDTQNRLVLTAPIAGLVTDLETSLHPGRWVNEKSMLAYVAGVAQSKVQAVATESDWARLAVGAAARFIPDDPLRPALSLRVQTIHELNEDTLTLVYLASLYGGDVPVRDDGRGRLKPERSIYRVLLDVVDEPRQLDQAVRGVVHIEGAPLSFMDRAWKWVSRVLIQESGF